MFSHMDAQHYQQLLEADGERIADVATGNLDSPMPALGDWTVRDLVAHTGGVYAFATANVLADATEMTRPGPEGAAPDGDAIIGWFRERQAAVLEALRTADPASTCWTFAGTRPRAFWTRRMAHETSVHRWDVEHALGVTTAIDPALAKDGIDEYTEVSLRYSTSRPNRTYPDKTLHLHATDIEGEWMLARGDDGSVVVTAEHGKGDAAVRGTAEALLLWVWGRPVAADELQIFGDEDVVAEWAALAP